MKQRGFAIEYLIAGIAALAIITALFFGVKGYLEDIDQQGFDRGQKETEVAYVNRDKAALEDALGKMKAAQDRVAAVEKKAGETFAALIADSQKDLDNEQARNKDVLDRVRNHDIVLRDPGAIASAVACNRDAAGAIAAGTGSGNGAAGTGLLSEAASVFLVAEAGRADQTAIALKACQAVVRADRQIINGP